MNEERTSWFTFGFSHAHSIAGFTFDKDIVVKITAKNPRQTMLDNFGTKWAMEYSEQPDMKYYPRGVYEL